MNRLEIVWIAHAAHSRSLLSKLGVAKVKLINRCFEFANFYIFLLKLYLELLTKITVSFIHFLIFLLKFLDHFLAVHLLKFKLLVFLVKFLALSFVMLVLVLEPHQLILWHLK